MENNPTYTGFEIAIVGMACRFPGAVNCKEYWNNLVNGVESIRFLSKEELSGLGIDEETIDHKDFVRAAADLPRKELFDSFFFNYRPDEAALLNPAHRIFHECAWEALEDAGYDPAQTKGLIGLYAGAGEDLGWQVYSMLSNRDQRIDNFTLSQLNNKDFLTSLLSYKLDLKGPSFTVSTACSTSLVAIHLACKSLLLGEARMILAGGVSIRTQKQKGYLYQEDMIQSPDGHCRAFDKDARGTVGGEGAGVIVLKRLKDALADRDHIYAVIKGSAINNDGNRKVGYAAPSVEGQVECIRMAHKISKVEPSSIGYVEAHGTGTRLGDPIEVEALNIAFQKEKNKHCLLGSVKTNIGHLDTAAGVAGLIKAALCLKYRQIPPTLHYKSPNPEIDFDGGPFHVNTVLKEWERRKDGPLRAGVSSFGIGGTNAHLILEEAPEPIKSDPGNEYKLLTLSAITESSLTNYINSLKTYLCNEPPDRLADLSYTLQVGRKHFEYRKSFVYSNREELIRMMGPGRSPEKAIRSKDRTNAVIFLFPGQGSQYVNMGRSLYEENPFFRETMDKGFLVLEELTGRSFKDILFSGNTGSSAINETRYSQPLIFLFEYSLACLLMSYGVSPRCMIGHSVGEYVAACISGLFNYENALKLIVKRGELMNSLPPGDMLGVSATVKEIRFLLTEGVSLAAVNGPEQVVLSGDPVSIAEAMQKLDELNISFVKLHTSHAFHSAMQDPIMDEFKKELEKVDFHKTGIPFISNLSGNFIREADACSPDYWVRHMRETVRFSDGIETLMVSSPDLIFIEVGAGHSLTSLVKRQSGKMKPAFFSLIKHARQPGDDLKLLSENIAGLWCMGVRIDWNAYYKAEKRNRVSLPTYAFENIKYSAEIDPFDEGMLKGLPGPAKNQELKNWIYYPVWKSAAWPAKDPVNDRKGYLIFSCGKNFSEPLKQCLLKKEDECIEIIPGEYYEQESKDSYILNPSRPDEFRKLFEDLTKDRIKITDIIYAWNIGVNPAHVELHETNKEINLLYFSLVHIIRNLLKKTSPETIRFLLITDRLHSVTGNEGVSPLSSLALGLINVLPQEYFVAGLNIDVNLQETDTGLYDMLSEEIKNNTRDRIVALRNGKRWLQDYQQHLLPLAKENNILQKEAVYVITGGAGKVGSILANFLLEKYQAKVVVIGRGDRWDEKQGIVYHRADVANLDELKVTVEHIEKNLGAIRGIIHAAGLTDRTYFELVEDISIENSFAVFSPKIQGIENIYTLFKDKPLDFVWVTSSLASLLGGIGYGAYSAANLYLDYFLTAKSKECKNWKSIQLSEMLLTDESRKKEKNNRRTGLKPAEIAELFEWSLTVKGHPVLLETVENLFSRIDRVYTDPKKKLLDSDPGPAAVEKIDRPSLNSIFTPPVTETEKTIVGMLEDFFGIKNIGVEDNFFELGGDSLKATIFLRRMAQTFQVKISLPDFFLAEHIRQICADIDEKLWLNKSSGKRFISTI